MAEVIARTEIKREPGYLYYVGKDCNVWCCKMKRGKSGSAGTAKKIANTDIKRETGYLYFIDKSGNVARSKMARGGKKKK